MSRSRLIERLNAGLDPKLTLISASAGFGKTTPAPFALVLDDHHVIETQPVHDTLIFLFDHLPPQTHLVIASRADPPLPLSRLRGRRSSEPASQRISGSARQPIYAHYQPTILQAPVSLWDLLTETRCDAVAVGMRV